MINFLLEQKAEVSAYDPVAIPAVKKVLGNQVEFGENAYEVAKGADCLAVVTEWNEFRDLDLEKIKKLMRTPLIADGRNIYDAERVKRLGFKYFGIGR